jgi:uncharacterized membrane protein
MSVPTNNSCHFDSGSDAHYDRVMFALALWQTVIAALAIVVTIIFGLLNGGHLRTFHVLQRHQTQQLMKHADGQRK